MPLLKPVVIAKKKLAPIFVDVFKKKSYPDDCSVPSPCNPSPMHDDTRTPEEAARDHSRKVSNIVDKHIELAFLKGDPKEIDAAIKFLKEAKAGMVPAQQEADETVAEEGVDDLFPAGNSVG